MAEAIFETLTVASEGVTLSALIWRRFRRRMPGLLERVLSLSENRGISALGCILPVGTTVVVPVETPKLEERRATVRLW